MGKHALRQRNGKAEQRKRKNRRRRVVKASSVSMAGLLAGGLVLAPHTESASAAATATVHEDVLLTATLIFIDGHQYPDSGQRMLTELQGNVKVPNPNCTVTANPCIPLTQPAPTDDPVFVQYPATLGLLDGPTAPTGNQSVAAAQQGLEAELKSNPPSATNPVTVTAYSEGAVAASHEVPNWPAGSNIAFLLIGNPERPNGGILARFPAGTYLPFLGITAGNATQSGDAPVVMVTRQYDGIADAPVYIGNVLADANAFLGFYYLHSTYYSVNPNDPTNIVTTSPDGTMTDILVPAAPGALPIFMPLAQAGVPQPVLVALDPAVRAIIETGYNRTSDPSQQVRFALLPPPSLWAADAQAITAGFTLTAQELPAALAGSFSGLPGLPTPLPAPTSPTPTTALASSPSPATALNSSAEPQRQLLLPPQPTPQGQQKLAEPTNNARTDVVARSSTPTTLASDVSAPGRGASQTESTPTKTDTTAHDASGKTAAPASNGVDTPAKRGTPSHSAATDAKHNGGAVTGNPTKDTSTSSSSSNTTSESRESDSDK